MMADIVGQEYAYHYIGPHEYDLSEPRQGTVLSRHLRKEMSDRENISVGKKDDPRKSDGKMKEVSDVIFDMEDMERDAPPIPIDDAEPEKRSEIHGPEYRYDTVPENENQYCGQSEFQ